MSPVTPLKSPTTSAFCAPPHYHYSSGQPWRYSLEGWKVNKTLAESTFDNPKFLYLTATSQETSHLKGVRGDYGGSVELHCPYVRGAARRIAPVDQVHRYRERGPVLPGRRKRRHVEGDVKGGDIQVPRIAFEYVGNEAAQGLPEVRTEEHYLFLLSRRKADEAANGRGTF